MRINEGYDGDVPTRRESGREDLSHATGATHDGHANHRRRLSAADRAFGGDVTTPCEARHRAHSPTGGRGCGRACER